MLALEVIFSRIRMGWTELVTRAVLFVAKIRAKLARHCRVLSNSRAVFCLFGLFFLITHAQRVCDFGLWQGSVTYIFKGS